MLRAAAKHFNISRERVDKMLTFSVQPRFRQEASTEWPKLDGFTVVIIAWLDADKAVHRKRCHTAKHLFDRLQAEHGVTGGSTFIKD